MDKLILFRDGSKDPESGHIGAAVYIPNINVGFKKRTTDNLSVYNAELLAIVMSLEWIEKHNGQKYVIASDSMAAFINH